MSFKVASVQFRPDMGRIADNVERMAAIVAQAVQEEGAELVCFPETAISGYYVEGAASENALAADEVLSLFSERLSGLKRPVDVLVGFYEKSVGQPHNSAAYLEIGSRVVGVYRKFFLPTYTVFDEERFVTRGTELGLFDTRLGKVGVLICEDVWHSVLSSVLALKGAEIICAPIASPARGFQGSEPSNVERYERMARAISEEHGVFTITSMLTGFEGGKGLVGGSVIFDPFGERLAKGDILDDHMVVAEIDLSKIAQARSKAPLLDDLRESWETIMNLSKD
ncbi:MAG: beta-ureidopropionase [Armatimonadetes bacterium]|nr:beta-ureidopropionase [Armatimonadota bacterium]